MVLTPADALERLRSPVETVTTIPAGPDEVYAVLADADTYAEWLVGAGQVCAAGPVCPALESDPPHRLVLEARLGPATRRIELRLERTSEGTEVRLSEQAVGGLAWAMPALRGLLYLRNQASLDRLRSRFEPLVIHL